MPAADAPPSLDALLLQLEDTLRAGDHTGAQALIEAIQQRLVLERLRYREDIEARVQALLPAVEALARRGRPVEDDIDLLANERGGLTKSFGVFSATAAATTQGRVYPVWFATNRRPLDPADLSRGFTGQRGDGTVHGRVDVFIPEAHRFGETGNGFWTRLSRFDLRDDRLAVQRLVPRAAADFWADLQAEMRRAEADGDPPHALVFLHGFKNTFQDAAIRAAQIGLDLKVPGATALFSWPSRGTLQGYAADEASIEASEGAITDFLVEFVRQSEAKKVHLLAHSMGNRGLLRALQRIAADAERRADVRFGQIFLAAPDVDRDLFLQLAHVYPACAERTTLYTSGADLPVHLSARLHDAPRAGYFLPDTVAAGIDTVAVPDFDIDLLGHSYFAQAAALLHDIYNLLRYNADPRTRQSVENFERDGQSFWRVRR